MKKGVVGDTAPVSNSRSGQSISCIQSSGLLYCIPRENFENDKRADSVAVRRITRGTKSRWTNSRQCLWMAEVDVSTTRGIP